MIKFNHPAITALSLAISLTLAACGQQGNDATSNKTDSAATTESKASSNKQEITINNSNEPESLDPHKVNGITESAVIRQILVGLITTDNEGKPIPGIAEKWENKDNKVWTFHLRDAKWSNGDPITADDFVYSWRRLVDPATASPYSSYPSDAKIANAQDIIDGKAKPETLGVKALDAKTLEVTLSEAIPYFPDMLSHSSMSAVNKKAVEQFGEKWTDPKNIVVSGAYIPTEWQVNEKIVMKRNSAYYNDTKTHINKITFLPIALSTTDVQRYKADEIDVTSQELPAEQFQSLKKEMADQLKVSPYLCTYQYEMNIKQAPFNDVRVRRALTLALDRDVISQKVTGRGEIPAYQFTPAATHNMGEANPEWKSWDKAKRISEAKKLLAEAGYSESKPLQFEILYNTNETHKKIVSAAISLWKEALGDKIIQATSTNQEWKTYLDTRRNGRYQMARGGWCSDYNEPSSFYNMFKTGNSNNHMGYNSNEFDTIIANTLKGNTTEEQRRELYHQAEQTLDKDTPSIFIYHYVVTRLVKPYVKGYSTKDPQNNFHVSDWYIAKH